MKLLIVESNGLFRDAFVRRFRSEEGIDLVGEIDHLNPVELPAEVEVLEPDIVLIGVGVADSDTLAAVNRVMAGRRHPGIVLHGRSLTLPAAMKIADILRSVDHGFAYLDSDRITSTDSLVSTARVVSEGKIVIDPQTTKRLLGLINTHVHAMAALTADERYMLGMMARGETDDAIAEALEIEKSLVSAMVIDVAEKFGVDGASRDARVTTILRYLVGIGELPMDYDTGAMVRQRSPALPPLQPDPRPPIEEAEPEPDDPSAEHAPEPPNAPDNEADDGLPDDPPRSAQSSGPSALRDVAIDERPGQYDSPHVRSMPTPSRAIGFHYGEQAIEEFAHFSQLGKPEDIEAALRILEWAAGRGLRVRWGSRTSGGSFALVLDAGSLSFWLLTVWAIGTVEVQFAMMMAQPPFSNVERRRDLADRLNMVQGVRIDEKALSGRPRVPLTSLRDQEDWELFTSAMDWVLREIRGFFEPAHQQRRDNAN